MLAQERVTIGADSLSVCLRPVLLERQRAAVVEVSLPFAICLLVVLLVGSDGRPQPVARAIFQGVHATSYLPDPLPRTAFRGVHGTAQLPQALGQDAFHGVSGAAWLPSDTVRGSPEASTLRRGWRVRFPGGGKVLVGYGMGVPLGVEEAILAS